MIQMLKNLIKVNDTNTNSAEEVNVEEKINNTLEPTVEVETYKCDCCGENEITIKVSDMFIKDENGESKALFAHPKVDNFGGSIYDGNVAICDDCFSACETDTQKQYVWTIGKINKLCKDVEDKNNLIASNNQAIEEIKAIAVQEISNYESCNENICLEINNLNDEIAFYMQEQSNIESELGISNNTNIAE